MKKRVLSIVLGTAMAASVLAGCGSTDSAEPAATEAPADADTAATEAATDAATTAAEGSTETATTEAAADAEAGDIPGGRVYLLNFKPETDDAWQDLAATYNGMGGNVTVVTAADGQYATTLQSEMAKSEAPTIFNIGNSTDAQTWDDYTYDLAGSAVYDHISDHSLDVLYNGKTAAIANCYEAYGIIYNKTILDAYCTLDGAKVASADEIQDFDTLKAVADDINSRVDELNEALAGTAFDGTVTEAFASAGLDDSSSWRFSGHLANFPLYYEFKDDGLEDLTAGEPEIKGTYLDQYQKVWDMYVADSAADPATLAGGTYNAEEELGLGEAVFYQNGDWEFSALTNPENGYIVTADDLDMMPIYFGVDDENEGLAVGTENHWAVNSKAAQEDIDASLYFLNWVITSDEGRDAIVNTMGLSAPFDTFTGDFAPANAFGAKAAVYTEAGKTSVAWSFNATPNVDDWRADVVSALTAYTDGSGDWDAVKDAFVTGWADQWKLAHAE